MGSRQEGPVRSVIAVALGVAAVAACARVSVPVPGSDVPQSLQTLAVVLVGAALGPVRGGMALLVYLGVGAAGLPVFADGAAGAEHLVGPTAGYLLGFVAAAVVVGALVRWQTGFMHTVGAMVLGHIVVLGAGWAGLAVRIGAGAAFEGGVQPFLWGGVVKSIVGAAMWAGWRLRAGNADPSGTRVGD